MINTNNVKKETNVIIFNDGSRKWTTEWVAKNIIESSTTKKQEHILLDGQLIRFSSIAKLLTGEEYYSQYPKEQTEPSLPTIKELIKKSGEKYVPLIDKIRGKKHPCQSMLKGIKKFINNQKEQNITIDNVTALYNKELLYYKNKYSKLEEPANSK